jgi:hypothetical protein
MKAEGCQGAMTLGTEQEFDGWAILLGFPVRVNGYKVDVGHCQAFCLQEQVAEVLIAAASVDEHSNVPGPPRRSLTIQHWCIYRVHLFAKEPRVFTVAPPLEDAVHLRPETWRASF